jgi:pimeloyl-ACP methyl ester carboxylesterase
MFDEHQARAWAARLDRTGKNGVGRASRLRPPGTMARVVVAVAVLLAAAFTSTSQAATLKATLQSHLLAVADLPYGWSAAPVTSTNGQVTTSPCGAALVVVLSPEGGLSVPGLAKSPLGPVYGVAGFVEGAGLPSLREALASGASAKAAWQRFGAVLAGCRAATFVYKGTKVKATGAPLAFTRLGRSASAYAWVVRVAGAQTGADVDFVLFQTAHYYGYMSYVYVGPPQVSTVTAFARAAVAKAATGSTAPVPGSGSIASAPVQTVRTSLGTVGYRSIGDGPPLVLVNGWSGTMEGWDPLLVDPLARHYRVISFDNAGIGRTQSLPPPLTIDEMADQTAAFIDALHLGRADVLGWSMGTEIVQALAVLHPSEARRLVLCAPYPGNGAAVLPAKAVLYANNDPTALFPANQSGAESIYDGAILSYPKAPAAPEATDAAQLTATQQWWAGADPAGHLVAKITAPTLLADGTDDRLDPTANSRLLQRLIPGARVVLYPDAGHAFLFQDYAAFAAVVESFLGQGQSS